MLVVPGGMYGHMSTAALPADYPQYFTRAEAARLWDADGRPYVDFMSAFGANLLGYGHPIVEEAVRSQARLGDTMTGPAPVMVSLAERFVEMIDSAAWAMFCKNGTDATSMAVVTARAATGRRKILVGRGAYHGAANWCTPNPAGILPEDRAHIYYYRSQDPQSLADAMRDCAGDVAAVIATPFRHETFRDQTEPDAAFAREARRLCDAAGAMLILDEVRAGFRLARRSAWADFGVAPDLIAFGKAIGNGHPISALLGAEHLRAAARSIYVTGSYWFSAAPMAAALATLGEIASSDYLERTAARGRELRDGLASLTRAYGFGLRQTGPVEMPQMLFDDDDDLTTGSAFCGAMVRRGIILHPYHNMFVSPALTDADMELTLEAAAQAFAEIASGAARRAAEPDTALGSRRRHAVAMDA